MLKVELHSHCNLDPKDNKFVKYSAKELIDLYSKHKYDVVAITCHDKVVHTKELTDYAATKNILLIPGVERTINEQHVLIYNITDKEAQKIKSFGDLQILKKDKAKEILIVAPHPFYPGKSCLGKNIIKYLNLFDAWEYSFFYSFFWNPNNKTKRLAKKYNKTMVGNGDIHQLKFINKTYSLINSKKDIKSIFEAIRNKKVEYVSNPISTKEFSKLFFSILKSKILNK